MIWFRYAWIVIGIVVWIIWTFYAIQDLIAVIQEKEEDGWICLNGATFLYWAGINLGMIFLLSLVYFFGTK